MALQSACQHPVWSHQSGNAGAIETPHCIGTGKPPDTIQILLWTTVAVFGIVYTLLGYRCLRAIGFLTGLATGAGPILWLQQGQITVLGRETVPALAIVTGLFGAILGSAHPIASVLIGGFCGALLAAAAIAACIVSFPDQIFGKQELLVATGGGAIIFAVLALCCGKFITILSTSFFGSFMITCSIDFFMHGLETIDWLVNVKPELEYPKCWGGILLCSWPIAAILGILVQCFITAWRIDHKRHKRRRRRQRSRSSGHRPRETREEARQRKYRYLYQVRTARGDIISQNFVSALQKRVQSGPSSEPSTKTSSNEHNTNRSDLTHMTNLADCDVNRINFINEPI
ncbi:transmembrane protein 198 isoform X2 [Culicoides brevitarsis]|uniref:transmembrane protein 198 isoform X2 n=1 Tax=Culicoides brevitarsis TaxID=469753 RepID=UPI00307BA1D9